MKKTIILLFLAASFTAHAEFGVSAGNTFNYKADFKTAAEPQGRATNPDTVGARTYDDGYVTTENPPIIPGSTRFYGYDEADGAQFNAARDTLTLNSSQSIIDEQASSGEQSEGQPSIEIYWQEELTKNEKWNVGLRAALRWQRIEIDSTSSYATTIEKISDTYTLSAPSPATVHNGPEPGSWPMLDENSRVRAPNSYVAGANILATRNLEADLFAVDFGPTLSLNLTEKLRITASVGGTVAWVHSKFSYEDGAFARGRDTKEDCLFGAYAGADLNYLIGERWGIFGGAAYTRLEDFEQEVDGRSAELQFDDSYTLRAGIFFR